MAAEIAAADHLRRCPDRHRGPGVVFAECFTGEPPEGSVTDDLARAKARRLRRRRTVGAAVGGVAALALSALLIGTLQGSGSVGLPADQPKPPGTTAGPDRERSRERCAAAEGAEAKECEARRRAEREKYAAEEKREAARRAEAEKQSAAAKREAEEKARSADKERTVQRAEAEAEKRRAEEEDRSVAKERAAKRAEAEQQAAGQ
ncbi:hypothetical protein [Microlunatus speluncae]|uniref:hypothetical protein n=1 Tax=Microlunatus speluncae TaxID=2594267 RepID=UPI001FED0E96|nr:hypothetical protein [Microlunatus speluncae]